MLNPDEFTHITRKITKTTKINATFRVLEELVSARSPLVLECGMKYLKKATAQSEAYIFKIDTPPDNIHFMQQGFIFKERHLRVDKFYSTSNTRSGKSGFAAAHYTETYCKPVSDETIIVHVYYCDNLQYVQIKKQTGQENVEWIDDTRLERTAKENAFEAFTFYKKIESEKNSRLLNALETADTAEKAIKNLSRLMSNETQILKYIQAIDAFCKLIQTVNIYNEHEKDCRDELMLQKVKPILQEKLALLKSKPAPAPKPVVVVTHEPQSQHDIEPEPNMSSDVKPPRVVQSQTAVSDNIDLAFNEIKRLSTELTKHLKSLTATSLAAAMRIAADLRIQLLLYTLPKKSKNSGKKKQLQTIDRQLDEIPTILNFATKAVLAGDVAAVCELYPFMDFTDQFFILSYVIEISVKSQTAGASELDRNLQAILEFFHEHSTHYELFIILQSGSLNVNTATQSGFSSMANIMLSNNKSLFDMLLRHKIQVDSLGFYMCNTFISLFKCCTFFTTDSYYIKQLLEYGATIDLPHHVFSLDPKKMKPLDGKTPLTMFDPKLKATNPIDSDLYREIQTIATQSDLVVSCRKANYELIPLLIPCSSFINQVHALAHIINSKHIARRIVHLSKVSGIFMLENIDKVNQISFEILCPQLEISHMALLIYPAQEFKSADFPYVKMLVDEVHNHCKAHPEDIPKTINQLEKMIKQHKPLENAIIYLACQILCIATLSNVPQNTVQRQKLMQLICQHGNCVKHKGEHHAANSYIQCIAISQDNRVLRATPLYKYAFDRIPEQYRQQLAAPLPPLTVSETEKALPATSQSKMN